MANTVQSVDRALEILERVSANPHGSGVRSLSREVELTPSAVQKMLNSLRERGLVEVDRETRRYHLGLKLQLLAGRANTLTLLKQFVEPYAEEANQILKESISSVGFLRDAFYILARKESSNPLRVVIPEALVENPEAWAGVRQILSNLSPMDWERWADRRGLDTALRRELERDFEKIRADGYAQTRNLTEDHIGAIAYPVRESDGTILMALGCSVPLHRFTPEFIGKAKAVLDKLTTKMTAARTS